jgi:hypothetical protein
MVGDACLDVVGAKRQLGCPEVMGSTQDPDVGRIAGPSEGDRDAVVELEHAAGVAALAILPDPRTAPAISRDHDSLRLLRDVRRIRRWPRRSAGTFRPSETFLLDLREQEINRALHDRAEVSGRMVMGEEVAEAFELVVKGLARDESNLELVGRWRWRWCGDGGRSWRSRSRRGERELGTCSG